MIIILKPLELEIATTYNIVFIVVSMSSIMKIILLVSKNRKYCLVSKDSTEFLINIDSDSVLEH